MPEIVSDRRDPDVRITELLAANNTLVERNRELVRAAGGPAFPAMIIGIVVGAALTIAILGCTAALIVAGAVPTHTAQRS